MANPAYFQGAVDPNSPWQHGVPAGSTSNESNSVKRGLPSPWINPVAPGEENDDSPESSSSHSPRRRERTRDKERPHRRRSRDRRSRDRNNERSRSNSRERRDKRSREGSDDSLRRRSRSRERRRQSSDEDEQSDRNRRDSKRSDRSPGRGDRKDDVSSKRSKQDSDKYSLEAANYKFQTPNETIMIRGLAQHITENDLRQDIVQCGLMPKDIRLIRKKETGVSRGFAFVEFNSTEEALCWMELKQGVLMLQDMYRAIMQFSIAVTDALGPANWQPSSDWDCPKCFAHNFKKRVTCYKCLAPKNESSNSSDPNFEISPHPTTKLVIRNLDALTTEEELLKEVSAISNISIQSCQISRDLLTNVSRCVCYMEMKNVLDAIKFFNDVTAKPLVVQNKKVTINYCKLHPEKSMIAIQPQPIPWSSDQQYTMADVPQLAEYSARMYASTPAQKAAYLQYYTQYYTNQLNQIAIPEGTDTNAAAAVAQSAIQMAQTKKAALTGSMALSTAAQGRPLTTAYPSCQQLIGSQAYGEPDVSAYVYEESSGYYFDSKTGLYYDSKTQYFYHSQDQQYLYWDSEKRCYQSASADSRQNKSDDKDDKKKEKDKQQDKVKVAKRIAKDMERWAKTLNQKKEVARQSAVAVQQAQNSAKSAATADIAFAVLERKEAGIMQDIPFAAYPEEEDKSALVASYGGGSDSDDTAEELNPYEDQHTDWSKLACLLCKRQFPTKDALQRHQQLSDLHRQNLESWYQSRGLEVPSDSQRWDNSGGGYRDRAKERRQKFGTPDAPKPNRLKQKYLKEQERAAPPPPPQPLSDNVGSKMLQKMGWSEGMGLGKMNQGRTDIVQATHRVATAGLGASGSNLGPAVGASGSTSYKEHVKRVAMARFSELSE